MRARCLCERRDCGRCRRRAYHRRWAARRRAAKQDAKRSGMTTCPYGRGKGRCGGVLRYETNGRGGMVVSCDRCERRRAGICRDCNARVVGTVGRADRCALHRRLAMQGYAATHYRRNRDEKRRAARAYTRRNRKALLAYKREWRLANPEKVKRQKERERARAHNRARIIAYHRARRLAGKRDAKREVRTCVSCPAPLTGRVKKCEACRAAHRRAARSAILSRIAA